MSNEIQQLQNQMETALIAISKIKMKIVKLLSDENITESKRQILKGEISGLALKESQIISSTVNKMMNTEEYKNAVASIKQATEDLTSIAEETINLTNSVNKLSKTFDKIVKFIGLVAPFVI
ncbi:hypothetical protein F908_02213 [Acinetobacter sp. NIPH 284]|uniref:hypothetical protein n=1 Tax=Acinetobacter sp. NIPH 284 TaxID=1217704 RepID=UPI0002D12BD0|nr:hypothetical protein [Acinetobacter sp. NIPH 284]ENW80016.1 hypothetical protein F908_02213 [Acinetobacter sp. NIPH 284]